MVHAESSTNLCLKCSSPLTFQPRVNINFDLSDSSSPLSLREMMSLCNEDLDDYDTEIIRLQSQISHVQAQRKRAIDYKTQINFLLSSFRRLPNEVLCLIFESTCAENLLRQYTWPHNTEEPFTADLPALVVSAVCTRWRSLALALPTLWSRITLEISLFEPFDDCHTVPSTLDGGLVRTLQLYLDRSVNAPLSIIVNSVEWGYNDPPALKLLLDHTHRWKDFAYRADRAMDQFIGLDLSFPILEKVALDPYKQGHPGEVACFKNAPNLRSVTGGQISDLSLAWNRLTSLDTQLHKGEDMALLRRYPALMVLVLRNLIITFEPGIARDPTSLAKLESFTLTELYISNRNPFLLESVFFSFIFPSLKELTILSEIHGAVLIWSQNAFCAFISRSACILTTLSLSGVDISDLNLIAALRLLPSLVKFNIDGLSDMDGGGPITTHFLSSLNGSSTPPILPKLCSLSMKINETSFDDATFVDMVSSRWLSNSQAATIGIDCLRSVVLHFSWRMVDTAVYKPLWQLVEMGMCVAITGQW